MTRERCGRDYEHRPHIWGESIDEEHRCDGGSDELDELEQQRQQDALFERGHYQEAGQ